MGFFKKLVKGITKGIGKIFKGIGKGLKKLWKSKLGKALVIGGALLAGGWALSAFSSGAAGGVAGAAAGSTAGAATPGLAASLGKGGAALTAGTADVALGSGAIGAGAGTAAALGKGGAQIVAGAADPALTAVSSGGGILGSASNMASAAWEGAKNLGGKAVGFMEANPTTTLIGGSMLSSAMQAKAQQEALEDERKYMQGLKNQETAYGVRYDGKGGTDGIDSASGLRQVNQQYAAGRGMLGGAMNNSNAPTAPAPQRKRVRFDPQTNEWQEIA